MALKRFYKFSITDTADKPSASELRDHYKFINLSIKGKWFKADRNIIEIADDNEGEDYKDQIIYVHSEGGKAYAPEPPFYTGDGPF